MLLAERRWNSGNLRVWGKRSPAALPYVGGQPYSREDLEERVGGDPIWLLPATADWPESGTSWDEASERVLPANVNGESTWNNANWRRRK